jgi:hypothetical protein
MRLLQRNLAALSEMRSPSFEPFGILVEAERHIVIYRWKFWQLERFIPGDQLIGSCRNQPLAQSLYMPPNTFFRRVRLTSEFTTAEPAARSIKAWMPGAPQILCWIVSLHVRKCRNNTFTIGGIDPNSPDRIVGLGQYVPARTAWNECRFHIDGDIDSKPKPAF